MNLQALLQEPHALFVVFRDKAFVPMLLQLRGAVKWTYLYCIDISIVFVFVLV